MHGRFPDTPHLPEVKVQRIIKADFHTGILSTVNENLRVIGLEFYILKYCRRYVLDDCILNSYVK